MAVFTCAAIIAAVGLALRAEFLRPFAPDGLALLEVLKLYARPLGALVIGVIFGCVGMRLYAASVNVAADAKQTTSAAEIDASGQALNQQIANALLAFNSQNESTVRYANALSRSQNRLTVAENAGQLQAIIHFLAEENDKMVRSNETYRQQLKASAEQVEKLRAELAISKEQSQEDALTKVASRRHFDETLTREIANAEQSRDALSLIMVDIDHFKKINDAHGHQIGDNLLQQVASILKLNTKGGDCVARYGGEEFAIVLPATSLKDAITVAEQIRDKLEKSRWQKRGGALIGVVTASLGVATWQPGESPTSLIERADAKLYKAKRDGRNRVTA